MVSEAVSGGGYRDGHVQILTASVFREKRNQTSAAGNKKTETALEYLLCTWPWHLLSLLW